MQLWLTDFADGGQAQANQPRPPYCHPRAHALRDPDRFLRLLLHSVERLGIARIRAIVVDDSEGIAARLEREIEESKAAYKDPWKEACQQASANQFASELPVLA